MKVHRDNIKFIEEVAFQKGYTLATKDVLKKIDRYFQFEFDNNVVNYTTLKNLKKFKASLKNSQDNSSCEYSRGSSDNALDNLESYSKHSADTNNQDVCSEEKQDDTK